MNPSKLKKLLSSLESHLSTCLLNLPVSEQPIDDILQAGAIMLLPKPSMLTLQHIGSQHDSISSEQQRYMATLEQHSIKFVNPSHDIQLPHVCNNCLNMLLALTAPFVTCSPPVSSLEQ